MTYLLFPIQTIVLATSLFLFNLEADPYVGKYLIFSNLV